MSQLPSAQTGNIFGAMSGVVSGIGGILGAKQEKKMGDYNASLLEQRATARRKSQDLLEIQKRKIIKSRIGTQVAQTGASGFRFTGDPITIMADSLANAEMDIAIDRYNSEIEARGFEGQASMTRFEASQRSSQKYVSAGTSFLETAAGSWIKQVGTKGTKLGAGKTSQGIRVPSRYVPPR